MANIENNNIKDVTGCVDPAATNYNPLTTSPCGPISGQQPQPDLGGVYTNGCCEYSVASLTGCMDTNANNYDNTAIIACPDCCEYGTSSGNNGDLGQNPGDGDLIIIINPGDTKPDDVSPCESQIYQIAQLTGEVLSNGQTINEECCKPEFIGSPVVWDIDSETCYIETELNDYDICESFSLGIISQKEFENRVICIDCDNFAWWDNLYTTINGASLQDTNQPLWNFLVEIITSNPENDPISNNFNNGSFYVDTLTGEPILGKECCDALENSNFTTYINELGEEISACICDRTPEIVENCDCIRNVEQFVSFASTEEGAAILLNVITLSSLGLTLAEANFVINNLFSNKDSDGDGISDSTNSRVLISNALNLSGGFYFCYEQNSTIIDISTVPTVPTRRRIPNSSNTIPVLITETKCADIGGYWDGILCYCDPIEDCDLKLTDISIQTQPDGFNQEVTLVTFNGSPISETCCLKIANENNLPWVYKIFDGTPNCFTKDPNPCLPLQFNLNGEPIKPECETPLDISVSFYFSTPENPCFEQDDDGEVIIIDGEEEPCLLEFDEENNVIDYNTVKPRRLDSSLNPPQLILTGSTTGDTTSEPCCFNPNIPIVANLVIKDTDNNILQTSDNFSFSTLETWYDLTTQFSLTTGTTEVNVSLQFVSGLNCCCTYDIFLDNFKFNCSDEETIVDIIRNNCPGFDIVPVIDNKKSWVYNPGNLNYSNLQNQAGIFTDNTIIRNGELGLIQGYGVVNRTFAPSPDADLPWRYTDYFKQSSVLEKHSNLVLNSKELFLTFDMCNIGGPCPDGYTLSAGTETCYSNTIGCPDGYTLSAGTTTCYSGETCDCLNIEWSLSGGTSGATLNTQFVGIQDGKRAWIFDVSGNTHSIEYRNSSSSWLIFEGGGGGSYQFSSTTECPTSTLVDWVDVGALPNFQFTGLTITEGICAGTTTSATTVTLTQKSDPLACKTKLTLLELEQYKKTFQSFWVGFVEQFIPATTIFVSGERWCNRPDEICTMYEECDFDFEFVEGDVTTIPNIGGIIPPREPNNGSRSTIIEESPYSGGFNEGLEPSDYLSTENGPIDTPGVKINPLPKENGETTTEPSVVNDIKNRLERMVEYRQRLQPTETIVE